MARRLLQFRTMLRFLVFAGLLCEVVSAAPRLRLATAALGPLFITQGQIGVTQSIAVSNAGDGTLALSASANVPWIVASITTAPSVQMGLNTASLARGKYTGIVTVTDPNAIDSPQTISVTIQVGDPVPDALDLYLPPGGSTTTTFPFIAGIPTTSTLLSPAST